ncbi:hypothetical protein [Bradyrhizobium sp. HKCCYLS20291]
MESLVFSLGAAAVAGTGIIGTGAAAVVAIVVAWLVIRAATRAS